MLCLLVINYYSNAQVKASYLYNTGMPYGTLDIRTRISSTNYFYLVENQTFSFRESSSGVKTNTYLDMTSFDSSPYTEGHLKRKNGSADLFVMNYRLLKPLSYSSTYAEGYPLMVLFHGAVERGNCYYNACYHSNWSYDPNVNNPPAPKTATHKLLNNDYNLQQGGKEHLDARNRAAGKLPNNTTLGSRDFPGFVLVPQMFNVWDSLNVQDAIRLVQLIAQKYNIDENRIYVHGLSIGGYAVYEAIKRAPWLFAAAQPMSAINDASIRKYKLQSKVAHIPLWAYQGGNDTNPAPAYTTQLVNDYKAAGSVVRYSLYSGVGHTCWPKAFAEAEFYSWMLSKRKENIHASKGITVIDASKAQYPILMLAEGFHAYQWEKDGVVISGATSFTYTAKTPGKYRARFSRVANPTSTQWNKWSAPITVTTSTARIASTEDVTVIEDIEAEDVFEMTTFPNPSSAEELFIQLETGDIETSVYLQLIDQMGKTHYQAEHTPAELAEGIRPQLSNGVANGIYIIMANQGRRSIKQKVMIQK